MSIFIAGTDTSCGKTVVTSFLLRYFKEKGYNPIFQKWVATGGDSDIKICIRFAKIKKIASSLICPYVFSYPASPHLSSRLENKEIKPSVIKNTFLSLKEKYNPVIVEGTGGLLVPISKKMLLIDIARELDLPILLVVLNKLGCINHTLLTIEAIKKRRMKIIGVIFNNKISERKEILIDNPRIIEELTGVYILGTLSYIRNKEKLYKEFIPIGERIFKNLTLSARL